MGRNFKGPNLSGIVLPGEKNITYWNPYAMYAEQDVKVVNYFNRYVHSTFVNGLNEKCIFNPNPLQANSEALY